MYVFITWLLINLLHPFALSFYFNSSTGFIFNKDFLEFYPLILLYSLMFSSVSLLLSYAALYFIKRGISKNHYRFIVWLLSALVITVINYWLFFQVLDGQKMSWENLELSIPAMITVAVVILLRYKYFIDTLQENHQDNMNMP